MSCRGGVSPPVAFLQGKSINKSPKVLDREKWYRYNIIDTYGVESHLDF